MGWLLPLLCAWVWPYVARGQDVGSQANVLFGNGAEISVTVMDATGQLVTSSATVRLLRDGMSSGEGVTTRGQFVFVVPVLGNFMVQVAAPGYQPAQKEISVQVAGRVQVDFNLRRAGAEVVVGVPGKPVLAPKAKEAFERGLQALSVDKLGEAQKHAGEAMRLAPGNPDVLYLQGVVDLRRRNFAEAQAELEKATQIDPGHARALAALGMALADQEKYGEAIAPLEKSLQLDAAGGYETHWTLAKAYYQHAQYEQALLASQTALRESHGRAPAIELLVAQSLTAVGKYEDSAAVLRGFLKNHGGRPETATARKWLDRLEASGKIAGYEAKK